MDKHYRPLCIVFQLMLSLPLAVVAQGPVHFWPLDETNGTMATDLNGGAHGTLQGGPLWTVDDGHLGGGLMFDGLDDRVDLGALDITTGSGFSIACWMRPGSTSLQDQLVVAKAYDPLFGDYVWSIGTALNSTVRFRLQTAGTTSTITSPTNSIFPGSFYHVAATYDGAAMTLYVNGALAATGAKTGLMGYHPQALAAMGDLDIGPGVLPFEGTIGDVRIWDRGLSQAEIIDLVLEQDISMDMATCAGATVVASGPITVTDISGRFVHTFNALPTALQTDVLPPGLYVLSWRDGDRVRSAKWMKS